MAAWEFAQRRKMSTQRDPVYEEFFTGGEAIDAAAALVRESIQNSLDAALADDAPVTVRIFASGEAGALGPEVASSYFEGLPDHLTSSRVAPGAAQMLARGCQFVVIEDFGTSGLTGRVDEFEEPQTGSNHFYYFFRAEGKSGKTAAERGRWGVGKYVFPMSSRINSFFAVTSRAGSGGDTDPLLLGKSILTNHQLDGEGFEPDGWWARIDDDAPLPLDAPEVVTRFCEDWSLSRLEGGSGTSVVIPFVRDGVDFPTLADAVASEYHLAILSGRLTVTLGESGRELALNRDNVGAQVPNLIRDPEKAELVVKDLDVYKWHRDQGADLPTVTFASGRAPKWADATFLAEELEALRAQFLQTGRAAVRVPVHVQTDAGATQEGYVTVVLEERPGHSGPPAYYREGILLSKEQDTARIHGVRAIVLVDEPAAAGMLGDAENPAHTKWSATTAKFKGKYQYGQSWLRVVRDSPQQLLKRLRGDVDEPDTNIAREFFSVSRAGGGTGGAGRGGGNDGPTSPPTPPIERVPAAFRVDGSNGSVRIRLGEHPKAKSATHLSGVVAYDVRRGNPFTKYRSEDFSLSDLEVQHPGAQWVTFTGGHQFTARIDDADAFELRLSGFDPNRDVIVNAWLEVEA